MKYPEPPRLTIAICTYRREQLLVDCLQSLANQDTDTPTFSILVVDNAGSPGLETITKKWGAEYLYEPQAGLSHARNAAWQHCATEWILYLDDDARAHPNLVKQAYRNIVAQSHFVFGGRFQHWFAAPPPKWFPTYFEGDGRPHLSTVPRELPAGDYLFGGIMAFTTQVLAEHHGFKAELGMQGASLGYGEEIELQLRLRRSGITIWYDPDLVIDHLVGSHKYTLRYHLEAAYRHGMTNEHVLGGKPYSLAQLTKDMFYTLLVRLPKGLVKLVVRKQYYWQNLVIEVVGRLRFAVGAWRGREKM
ncbi:MAG: glycosyltransferase [Bacteroidota bacterium]